MFNFRQGDVMVIDLNPTKGVETQKKRPCVVVSNNHYNHHLNTVIVAPISSSEKYTEEYYSQSPFFIQIPDNDIVHGTILLQHLRSIDPKARTKSVVLYQLPKEIIEKMKAVVHHFF